MLEEYISHLGDLSQVTPALGMEATPKWCVQPALDVLPYLYKEMFCVPFITSLPDSFAICSAFLFLLKKF